MLLSNPIFPVYVAYKSIYSLKAYILKLIRIVVLCVNITYILISWIILTHFLFQVIQAIGVTVYQALDYGLIETEERHLSPDLESLIEYMTNPDYKKDNELQNADDEGIENDTDEDCFMQTQPTLSEIITVS